MSTNELDPRFAAAVRDELAAIGTGQSRLRQHQRRVRALAIGVGVVVIAAATAGAALVVNQLPGTTIVSPLGGGTTVTHTGSGTIDLGPAPEHVGAVVMTVSCLNVGGSITVPGPDGGFETFYCKGFPTTWHMDNAAPPKAGTTTIRITADPRTEWRITAEYASSVTTAWGVNAHGQTFGKCDAKGCPDLMAVQKLPDQEGYVFTKAFADFRGPGYLKVYASDGTTVIGRFALGIPNSGEFGYGGTTLPPQYRN